VVHREGVPPTDGDRWCFTDIERAADKLDDIMLEAMSAAEYVAEGDDENASATIDKARDLGHERWVGTGTGLVGEDPGEWIDQGPFVEALGVNYGIDGCNCERGYAIEVASALADKAADVYAVYEVAVTRAKEARTFADAADQINHMQPSEHNGIGKRLLASVASAAEGTQKAIQLLAQIPEGRANVLIKAASTGDVTRCGPGGGGCGEVAVVKVDGKRAECQWCGIVPGFG
jgi:hypothetical protein